MSMSFAAQLRRPEHTSTPAARGATQSCGPFAGPAETRARPPARRARADAADSLATIAGFRRSIR